MDIKFGEFFDDRILKRGYEYYMRGQVRNMVVSPNQVRASVYGSEIYQVNVILKNEVIQEMDCNCPYANHSYCKHEAAVVYALNDDNFDDEASLKITDAQDSEMDILAGIPKEDIVEFLIKEMNKNDSFRLNFHSYFSQYYPISYTEFVNEWNSLIYQYSGRDGFINYEQSSSFEIAVSIFNDKLLHASQHHPKIIFKVITKLYYELCNFSIDDSNGTTYNIACEFQNIILECYRESDEILKAEIQTWLIDAMETSELENYGLDSGLDELYRKTLTIDEQIQYLLENVRNSHEIEDLLSLLQEAGKDEKEIYAIIVQFQYINSARDWLIDYNLKHQEINEAISLLLSGSDMRNGESYTLRLLQVYNEYGFQDEYEALVRKYLSEPHNHIVDLYLEFKCKHSVEEWNQIFPDLIKSISSTKDRMQCYANENMKKSLIEEIEKSTQSFDDILDYENMLLPEYEDRLIRTYRSIAEKIYPYTGNHNYSLITEIIKHIIDLPNGLSVAKEMVYQLKMEYKARRNLIKLLNKLPIYEECEY